MYDVVIVGAGPGGIFSALELSKHSNLSVALVDKGSSISKRFCPSNSNGSSCVQTCEPCSTMCGFGGAGAFSDGKLNIAQDLLGDVRIGNYISTDDFIRLVKKVDDIWLGYGAPDKVFGEDKEKTDEYYKKCKHAGIKLLVSKIRHLGTDLAFNSLKEMQNNLKESGVDLIFKKKVEKLVPNCSKIEGVQLEDGELIKAKNVAVFPGRDGTTWFEKQCRDLKLQMQTHPVDLGVRVEVPAEVTKKLTDVLYEPKMFARPNPFRDQVRTFCVCPGGSVTVETVKINGSKITSVNGHSYKDKKTENTNFALLAKTDFTSPFNQPTLYAAHIAHLANLLSGGVLVQRLGDVLAGRRSTRRRIERSRIVPTLKTAVPGDISYALPYRQLTNIIETLRSMEKVMPGIFSMSDTLLYAAEVKFYSASPKLSSSLETEVKNLFAGGDGVGVSRNLVHASVCGLKVAEEIIKRNGGK